MAPRPKFRKPNSLLPRILSGLVLIPLSLYVIYLGPPFSLVLAGLVIFGITIEWAFLCLKNYFSPLKKFTFILIGTVYIALSLDVLFMNFLQPDGWKLIFWLLFLVWSIDIAAYAGGKAFRGPKLAPSISPNKTWSGFLCGVIAGVSIGYGSALWLVPDRFSLIGITLLVFIAQLGDLLESKAKRWSNTKDSSPLIPGHGGLLDRLDSLIAVGFALFIWQAIYS